MASPAQAETMMVKSLSKFEVAGGLLSGTETSRGKITLNRPNRQWDYPAAWPPHQIMAWAGLVKYGYVAEAQRLAYRWLYMVTCGFVEAGGVVPEKFNAVESSANIDAEYGNQGTDFIHVPREGFGWCVVSCSEILFWASAVADDDFTICRTNASYQIGLATISPHQRRALGTLAPPDTFFYGGRNGRSV